MYYSRLVRCIRTREDPCPCVSGGRHAAVWAKLKMQGGGGSAPFSPQGGGLVQHKATTCLLESLGWVG